MTVTVYEFPREWYGSDGLGGAVGDASVVTGKFRPRSRSQVSARTWTGGSNVSGPTSKMWLADVTMSPMRDSTLQDMKAFMSQLDGQSGVLRMADASRLAPWYDRNLTATTATFSDGSTFTDGSGFASGYLPPEVFVYSAAARAANYIVLGGFPVSTANVLRAGDLLQIKPNGIAGSVPHLYEVRVGGSSDSSGRVGVSLNVRLRQAIAAGDVVGLRYASTLFRLADDTQGEVEDTGAGVGSVGFTLVEALDLVP